MVTPVNSDVNLTALFGAPTVDFNGPIFAACALVSSVGANIPSVVVEATYLPAP